MPQAITIKEIQSILPHRYPFLLVDRVTDYAPEKYIKAYKNLTINEPFFQGHFPDTPVMPGVLIIEAMAQAGALFVGLSDKQLKEDKNKIYLITGIEKARFRRPVFPGDRLDLECANMRHRLQLWKMEARAYVNGELVAEASLTAAANDKSSFQQ